MLLQKYFDWPTEVIQHWTGAQRSARGGTQEEEPYGN